VDSVGSGYVLMLSCCECGDNTSGSGARDLAINCSEFLNTRVTAT
jgi:hypothetical protein